MRTKPFDEADLTRNAFLSGKIRLWQPKDGYRAGIDPVLLAATVQAKPSETVLELGCGAGPAFCCLAARIPGLKVIGVEKQPAYAALARLNASENSIDAQIYESDLNALPDSLRRHQVHHVIANPPYFEPSRRTASSDAGREHGLAEDTPLADWARVAAKRLRPGGTATFVHRAERLPDLLAAMSPDLGSLEVLPLVPRLQRTARLILVRGRKGGRADFRLHSPIILHQGLAHMSDGDDYSAEISAVLRDGAALEFPSLQTNLSQNQRNNPPIRNDAT